jgi:hypothetical protein
VVAYCVPATQSNCTVGVEDGAGLGVTVVVADGAGLGEEVGDGVALAMGDGEGRLVGAALAEGNVEGPTDCRADTPGDGADVAGAIVGVVVTVTRGLGGPAGFDCATEEDTLDAPPPPQPEKIANAAITCKPNSRPRCRGRDRYRASRRCGGFNLTSFNAWN